MVLVHYCRIAKLALDEMKFISSSTVPKAASTKPISRLYSTFSSTLASTGTTKPKFPRFSSWHHIVMTTRRSTLHSSFFSVYKRYYHGHGHRSEFRRMWYQCYQWVKRNPEIGLAMILVGSAVVASVFLCRFETIPYSKRTHIVFSNSNWEKKLGQYEFDKLKAQKFKGRILPDVHQETIRVRAIAKDLIGALNRGISLEQDYDHVVMPALMDDFNKESRDSVIRDDMLIENRKKSKQRGSRDAISHLNGLSWEILVVDEPTVNAFCLPGGKIVLFTGLLNHFSSDAEIATIIGHEVGHVMGRHAAENITKGIWIAILLLLVRLFTDVETANIVSDLRKVLLTLPNSRRMEMEADHIGLLLLASAGYDPTLAPGVYKKLSEGESKIDYFSTHPSGKKRAENLSRAKIMEEALSIYRDVKSSEGRGVKGLIL